MMNNSALWWRQGVKVQVKDDQFLRKQQGTGQSQSTGERWLPETGVGHGKPREDIRLHRLFRADHRALNVLQKELVCTGQLTRMMHDSFHYLLCSSHRNILNELFSHFKTVINEWIQRCLCFSWKTINFVFTIYLRMYICNCNALQGSPLGYKRPFQQHHYYFKNPWISSFEKILQLSELVYWLNE